MTNVTPASSPEPTGTPPPSNPDIWLAVITAAVQTYVHLGKVTGPVTVATVTSVVEDAQNQQLIAPPAAASVLEYVQTSEGAALVEHSATLANHTFAILNVQASAPANPDQPRTYTADQPRTYAAETVSEAAAANPATPEQKNLPS